MVTSFLVSLLALVPASPYHVDAAVVAAPQVVEIAYTVGDAVGETLSVPSADAASVDGSGSISVTTEEKAVVKAGMLQGVANLVSLLMLFSDIIVIVAAAFMGLAWLRSFLQRR